MAFDPAIMTAQIIFDRAILAVGNTDFGRYPGVAAALQALGAEVVGADHLGHGRSDGERLQIEDFEVLVDDLDRVVQLASVANPDLPLVMVGHSMGGMIATRYAQRQRDRLAALVLSGPLVGPWPVAPMLLATDPMPDFPIDPQLLSRDPAVQQAYAILENIEAGGGVPDSETIRLATEQAAAASDSPVITAMALLIVICWIVGIIDAYRIGRQKDREGQMN